MQLPLEVLSIALLCAAGGVARAANSEPAANEHLERAKRWLNYPVNGGVAKSVMGIVVPIRFHHPLPRVIVNTYNLQANYRIPADIIYPYSESVWKNRALAQHRRDGWTDPPTGDRSRKELFALLERSWTARGSNGHACLLRAVCEVAEAPLKHNGLIGEIIDVIFTPSPTDELDPDYREAHGHGSDGHGCIPLYPDCPVGHGFFDSVSMLAL